MTRGSIHQIWRQIVWMLAAVPRRSLLLNHGRSFWQHQRGHKTLHPTLWHETVNGTNHAVHPVHSMSDMHASPKTHTMPCLVWCWRNNMFKWSSTTTWSLLAKSKMLKWVDVVRCGLGECHGAGKEKDDVVSISKHICSQTALWGVSPLPWHPTSYEQVFLGVAQKQHEENYRNIHFWN